MKISSKVITLFLISTVMTALLAQPCAAGSSQVSLPGGTELRPALRCFDVTIYYRPPVERLDVWDWGHILLYVRNDATGESAYFDYYPEDDYSVLGAVDQARIDAHASLTIETTPEQERAILEGIREMQQKLPDWKLRIIAVLFGSSSTCVSRSLELLQRGGINLKGRDPRGVWADAWQKYSNEYLTWKESQGSRKGRYRPGSGATSPQIGLEYGRDPHKQARRADPKAINNQTMYFKNGRRVK
ncbi:MAG: hypothetical protein U0Z53_20020 [Blastocatellia bacterium]